MLIIAKIMVECACPIYGAPLTNEPHHARSDWPSYFHRQFLLYASRRVEVKKSRSPLPLYSSRHTSRRTISLDFPDTLHFDYSFAISDTPTSRVSIPCTVSPFCADNLLTLTSVLEARLEQADVLKKVRSITPSQLVALLTSTGCRCHQGSSARLQLRLQ